MGSPGPEDKNDDDLTNNSSLQDSTPQVLLKGNSEPLTKSLTGVHPGDVVFLKIESPNAESSILWKTSDVSKAVFERPGELHILQVGEFEVIIQIGDFMLSLQVVVEPLKASPPPNDRAREPESNEPQEESGSNQNSETSPDTTEEPSKDLPPPNDQDKSDPCNKDQSPNQLRFTNPIHDLLNGCIKIYIPGITVPLNATPFIDTLPDFVPPELADPEENPAPEDPEPSEGCDQNDGYLPQPTPVDSDPYMDEVVSFNPGPHAGFGAHRFPDIVLGPPKGMGQSFGSLDVLSLGVEGEIILKSDTPILNEEGADLIVFENPFMVNGSEAVFAELGEVAVSQDGLTWHTFPCEKENSEDLYPGCAGVSPVLANPERNSIDPTDPDQAGGDAFDLDEVCLSWAQYVRITALSQGGSGTSAGFDLDAVAVVHQ